MKLSYTIIISGPPYGTQQAITAYLFAQALVKLGHSINSLFFYQDGVYNANKLTQPASDEHDLVTAWQQFSVNYSIPLNLCVSAALRRGVVDDQEGQSNITDGFILSGLAGLAESMLKSDRVVQF